MFLEAKGTTRVLQLFEDGKTGLMSAGPGASKEELLGHIVDVILLYLGEIP